MEERQEAAFPSGPLEPGTLLNGRYHILKVIGRGGMGMVYQARHLGLNAIVAVKEVYGPEHETAAYREALALCRREAETLSHIKHANLPQVMDAFDERERFFLVMEYIEGETLDARIRRAGEEPIDILQAIEWGLQIADVLEYLHSQTPPLIFRDLKPANVMLQADNKIRLIDFGIARRFQPDASKDTTLLGSVGYSPPEQFGTHQTDARSDIYALGATLHQLLTLRDPAAQPFKFPPANALNPRIPEPLSQLLDRCLAFEADNRPQSMHEVAMELVEIRDRMLERIAEMPPEANALVPSAKGTFLESKSGRARIISPRLAEEERKGMRASASLPILPTAEKPNSSARRAPIGLALGALVVVLAIAGGVTVYRSRTSGANAPRAQAAPRLTEKPAPQNRPTQNLPIQNPPTLQPVPDPPQPQERVVEFTRVEAQGIVEDAQGAGWLRLAIAGRIRKQANQSGMIAAFFYDMEGNPIPARTISEQNPYANRSGSLSVAQSIQIASDDWLFEQSLDVPLAAFPASAASLPIRLRCAVFLNNKNVGDSGLRDIPFALPIPPDAALPSTPGTGG